MINKQISSFIEFVLIVAVVGGIVLGFAWLLSQTLLFIKTFDNDTKIELFENGKTLRCYSTEFSSEGFLVNKENGWELYKESFKKEDRLILFHRCREEE